MKKNIILFGLLTLLFSKTIFAAGAMPVPMVNCGNSESSDINNQKCCASGNGDSSSIDPDSFTSKLSVVPGFVIPEFIKDVFININQTKRDSTYPACVIGTPSLSDQNNPNCICLSSSKITPTPLAELKRMCGDYFRDPKQSLEKAQCEECSGQAGVWTAMGCMYGDVNIFIEKNILGFGIGFAGSLSLLCIIYSAFQMQTSMGNPEKIKKAQELLTSCITGLILIIFSIFLLRLIGVTILKIPGMS